MDPISLTATEAVAALKAGRVTPTELVEAAVARIRTVDPALNATVTLCPERALEAARRIGRMPSDARADEPGWLAGLPILVKDLTPVAGVRTTYGSRAFADHVPERSDLLVERLEANGAVVLGKTNTPEFGAGAVTFNEVFGRTLNPWNTALTPGGSSGGSAAAVATGQAWLATGSDFGGSLRIPAAFCGVVGLRPSPGTVPHGPAALPYDPFFVDGPIGRSVADTALMLDAMAGDHPEDPQARPAPAVPYAEWARRATPPARIAWTPDLGQVRVDGEVARICAGAARRFADLGTVVAETTPDFAGTGEAYRTLRGLLYVNAFAPLLEKRDLLKPEVAWNIEQGLALSGAEIGAAERARGALIARMGAFFRTHDLLVCPTVVVPPFDAGLRYLESLDGVPFATYYDWLFLTFAISMTGCPCLSLPCGFTASGLPVGLQLVAPWNREGPLLAAAAALEAALGLARGLPIDPRPPGV